MNLTHIINDLYNFDFTSNTFADKKHENAIKRIFTENNLIQLEKDADDKRVAILKNRKNLLTTVEELKNDFLFIEQPFGSQKSPDFIICIAGFILWIECKSGKKLVWNTGYPKNNVLFVFSSKATNRTTLFFGQFTDLLMKNPNFEVDYEKMDKEIKKICKDIFTDKFDTKLFELYHRRMLTDKTKYHTTEIREDFFSKTISLLGI